jgi:hypothetical protein
MAVIKAIKKRAANAPKCLSKIMLHLGALAAPLPTTACRPFTDGRRFAFKINFVRSLDAVAPSCIGH